MFKKVSSVISYAFNGNIEADVKFVEVDGKKFQSEDGKAPKKDDKGNPIPFEEKKIDLDISSADLEALAKVNPAVAKFLADKGEVDKKLADITKAEDERKRKEAENKGEWQKLADEEKQKRIDLEKTLALKEDILGKYVGSVESILKQMTATIPKEKQSLIPEKFSAREKLDYIIANAKLLGATAVNKDGKIPTNDDIPNVTEEEETVKKFDALLKNKNRTRQEDTQMYELSQKLKELRQKKLAEKK